MDKLEFFKAVLGKLNIPYSDQAIAFLMEWAKYEKRPAGRPHGFNPLNTTWDNRVFDPAQTNYNSNAGYPVKNYSNFNSGVDATANTLKLTYYKNIIKALKAAQPLDLTLRTKGIAKELKTWGTHTFAYKFIDGKKETPKQKSDDQTGKIIVTLILLLGLFVVLNNYVD